MPRVSATTAAEKSGKRPRWTMIRCAIDLSWFIAGFVFCERPRNRGVTDDVTRPRERRDDASLWPTRKFVTTSKTKVGIGPYELALRAAASRALYESEGRADGSDGLPWAPRLQG